MSLQGRVPSLLDREGETVAPSRAGLTFSPEAAEPSTTLDPQDWGALRRQGHRMLDDMFDHLEGLREQPVWQCAPGHIRAAMRAPLPIEPVDLAEVHAGFRETILPYGGGNIHPGFMGWVQGGGTAVGMLAEMLAGGLNANLGGRDHMPIAVEQQIVAWMREIFGFPSTADGLFLTGASQANFVALLIARTRACGGDVPHSRSIHLRASGCMIPPSTNHLSTHARKIFGTCSLVVVRYRPRPTGHTI